VYVLGMLIEPLFTWEHGPDSEREDTVGCTVVEPMVVGVRSKSLSWMLLGVSPDGRADDTVQRMAVVSQEYGYFIIKIDLAYALFHYG
jgi:hypothetical protein